MQIICNNHLEKEKNFLHNRVRAAEVRRAHREGTAVNTLALDIGGTSIKSALFDERGTILAEDETQSDGKLGGPAVMKTALAIVDGYGDYGRIGVSTSGQFLWWLTLFPGLAIFFTVTAYNLLGEGLRDAIDPKLRKAV
jgi:hypothetical protein